MASTPSGQDEVRFVDEAPAAAAGGASTPASTQPKFKIMIVDDDKDVHLVTKQVLSTYFSRADLPVFLHAYNSLDAYTMLSWERDVSVVLLDVVMESDDAGLKLVSSIRGDLNLSRTQIILRTGQPGLAKEERVIADYEINGYLAKSDLTPSKLYSAVMAARRNYLQLTKEYAAAAAAGAHPKPMAAQSGIFELNSFTLDTMVHIAALFKTPCMGFTLRRAARDQPLIVTVTTPDFANLVGLGLEAIRDAAFSQRVATCLTEKKSLIDRSAATLYLPGRQFPDAIMHLVRKLEAPAPEPKVLETLMNTYINGADHLLRSQEK